MNILLIFFIMLIIILAGIYIILALSIAQLVITIQNRNILLDSLNDTASTSCSCRNRNR
jgi:hypothetical protein